MASDSHLDPAVAALLADPATHGLPADTPVVRIDTHAAAVFLAGPRAYKVKRAVRYPFLDYSTLARREAACRAELAANRPFAAELYRGVVPITRGCGGRLALGGQGEPVEWAVEMTRFDETATLDRLADRGELTDALARALAEAVADGHARAAPVAAEPWLAALARFAADNREAFRAAPELFDGAAVARLDADTHAALARVAPLIRARGTAGHVRHGHGDLHLANVALIDGRPVLFDAIEFDPLIAAGDVLYELAFLVMDLLARDLPRAASLVFNRYLHVVGRAAHLPGLAALPLYLSLRAQIRAKVAAARAAVTDGPARGAAQADARRYFARAVTLLEPVAPRLVGLGGLSGTGKSSVAASLAPLVAPAPGALHLRSDEARKRLFGVADTDRLPAAAYTQEVTERVYATLFDDAKVALAAGHSVLVDAVFARHEERAALAAVAAACDAPLTGMWLEAPLDVRLARVGARTGDASDADAAVVRAQAGYCIGALDWTVIDAGRGVAEVLADARAALSSGG